MANISLALARKLGIVTPPRHRREKKTPQPKIMPACFAAAGLPAPEMEWRFHPRRKWALDFCWVEYGIALECEGGVWTGGRHTRGSGFLGDVDKYNAAAIAGYRLLRCTPKQLANGAAAEIVRRAFLSLHPEVFKP